MKIEIVSDIKKRMKMDNKYIKDVLAGKIEIDRRKAEKTMIITPEVFVKIFSPQRVRLILRIEKNKLNNIYQLAKELNRKYEAVYRDIKYLEGMGIIKLKEKDKKKIPFIDEPVELPKFAAG
jgi:predicted transcriptional regulator